MNKFLDLIIATQFSTTVAFFCAIGAHLVDKFANENWQFSVYFLLVVSVIFMLMPYILFMNEENRRESNHTR